MLLPTEPTNSKISLPFRSVPNIVYGIFSCNIEITFGGMAENGYRHRSPDHAAVKHRRELLWRLLRLVAGLDEIFDSCYTDGFHNRISKIAFIYRQNSFITPEPDAVHSALKPPARNNTIRCISPSKINSAFC